MIMKYLKISNEDLAKNTSSENEVVIYAKVTNPEGLANASSTEQHEQAEIKTDKGKLRVRKITSIGKDPSYELTAKIKQTDDTNVKSSTEITRKISEDLYNLVMTTATSYMVKTRYVFKVEKLKVKVNNLEAEINAKDMNWEVNVFTNKHGKTSQWCKIDLEVDNLRSLLEENRLEVGDIKLIATLSKLPFGPNDIVVDDKSDDEPEKAELIKALYENEFVIPR